MFDPDVYPMNWSKITGRIPEEEMKHHHALEWEEIEGVTPSSNDATSDQDEKLLEKAEETKAKTRNGIEGPWKLESDIKPYSSKKFKVEEAKKVLDKK
jgi:hypothetical protein